MEVLRSEWPLPNGFLIHAYGGSAELIHPLLDLGAFFSFAGSILEERRTRSQAVMCRVPLDRLLIETDAPDLLPPVEHRPFLLRDADGREKNHPANLRSILEGVARLRQLSPERLAGQLWDNNQRFLGGLLVGEP
jgi:TatD DNase family protein